MASARPSGRKSQRTRPDGGKAGPLQSGTRAETTLERWQQVHALRARNVSYSSSVAKATLKFSMTELINGANLAKYATLSVSVSQEAHQPPGQAAVQCEPAACDHKSAISSLEKCYPKANRDCCPYPYPYPYTESAAEPKRNCCSGSHSQEGCAVADQCCMWIGSYSWIGR